MKLLRYGETGSERPGLLDADGTIRDLGGHVADIGGKALDPASLDALAKLDPKSLPAVSGKPRIGACVAGTPHHPAREGPEDEHDRQNDQANGPRPHGLLHALL